MSINTTPIFYLNLGGEMLYILRQRLKAQRIDVEKSIQVLDDVTLALLDPKTLSLIFEKTPLMDTSSIRSILERVVLCSIMKLDGNSMNKLFELMYTMVKYQMTVATGPREVILITLNHTDAMRDMVSDENAHQCVSLVHQMIVDLYSNLTYEEIWKVRNECLDVLKSINVRMTILLRLGLQNENATFNIGKQTYNERYDQQKAKVAHLKLTDVNCDKSTYGSFNLFGDRITLLGRNIYSPTYGNVPKPCLKRNSRQVLVDSRQLLKTDSGCKAELGMLALQLGTEETTYERPFSLNLYISDENMNSHTDQNHKELKVNEEESKIENNASIDKEYKNELENLCDLQDESTNIKQSMDLLKLLDEV